MLINIIKSMPSVAPIVLITDPLPLNMRPTGTFVNPPIPSSNWAGGIHFKLLINYNLSASPIPRSF